MKALAAWSQSPGADFSIPASLCSTETPNIVNNSTNADAYEWDFCLNDFSTLKSSTSLATISALQTGEGFKLIDDNGHWYGFATSRDNNKFLRFDFGNSPENAPVITDLGNPGGLLHLPEGFDIMKANGNWYAFVGSLDFAVAGSGIIRLDFGNTLANTPTAINLGNFGFTVRFRNLRLVQQGADLIMVLPNYNGGSVIRINYRNSFDNPITGADIFDTGFLTNLPVGVNVLKHGSDWIMHVVSLTGNSILQLNFGADLLTTPVVEGTYGFPSLSFPDKIDVIREGDQFFAVVSNSLQSFVIINFKDLNPANAPVDVSLGGLPGILGLDVTRWQGRNIVIGTGNASNEVKRIVFESICGASILYSTQEDPVMFYTTSGSKSIELIAKQTSTGLSSIFSQTVSVSALIPPDINFTTLGVCNSEDVTFNPSSVAGGIVSYNWNFGDGNISTSTNPIHQYTASGDFIASLSITTSNGCNNYIENVISIFDQPIPDFSIPSTSPLCTNQPYLFNNASTIDPGYPATWQWKVNSVNVSTAEDLTNAFTSTANQDISLTASIPGCDNEIIKSITSLVDGALVDFSFTGICEEESTIFANNTTGSVSGYIWDFNDGQTTMIVNPTHQFISPGTYNVMLTANSVGGCVNSISKQVIIRSKPVVNFEASLPPFSCNGSPTQFTDLTPGPTDSNLTSWQWDFGDAGSTSLQRNPQHTYALANTYNVTLTVSTNYLCSSTLQLPVLISQSPVPDFTFAPPCEDLPVNFSGTSSGSIQSWAWMIGGTPSANQNPTHTFLNPGNTNASLTVTAVNNCTGSVNKPITVIGKQSPDFSVARNCTQQQTLFTNITTPTSDPINLLSWNFDGQGTETGSPVTFSFFDQGNADVTLTVTTQAGCIYPVAKSVTILPSPQANFLSIPQPNAPLTIHYTNTSTNATSFLWTFHNNTTSTQVSPTFTYPAFGQYQTDLTASNTQGCFQTVSKLIDVIVPEYDVELNGLAVVESQPGILTPAVTIFNNGNVPITNVELLIEANGESAQETVSQLIMPNSSYRHVLSFQLTTEMNANYFCIEANVDDVSPADNKVCLFLEPSFKIFPPYPNPANGILNLEIILYEDGLVNLTLVNSMGQEVRGIRVNSVEGLNPLQLETQNLPAGPHVLRVQYNHSTIFYKVSVVGH